jgi:hypothetical protein
MPPELIKFTTNGERINDELVIVQMGFHKALKSYQPNHLTPAQSCKKSKSVGEKKKIFGHKYQNTPHLKWRGGEMEDEEYIRTLYNIFPQAGREVYRLV